MPLQIVAFHTVVQDHLQQHAAFDDTPLRKVAVAAIVKNPHAGRFAADLSAMIEDSEALGAKLAEMARSAMGEYPVESYGKGGIVGTDGEQEHANALLTTVFATPLRAALGGTAWISSFTKCAASGESIDVPLAHKDELYVRSHYDGMSVTLPGAPMPDEIAVIFCVANRGRLTARVGGLKANEVTQARALI
ncbi:amino acid synthesis family protein [Burkholderia sp. L27(2015)]|uniref:amino acid synthesis family protein n=1 Tax=Burkholderia sp. L27(2015) TaxID=1641858 RepID=UPI00131EAC90|nr:amino acid synthesis family protein [Burkholderia sp. L27(2015)]